MPLMFVALCVLDWLSSCFRVLFVVVLLLLCCVCAWRVESSRVDGRRENSNQPKRSGVPTTTTTNTPEGQTTHTQRVGLSVWVWSVVGVCLCVPYCPLPVARRSPFERFSSLRCFAFTLILLTVSPSPRGKKGTQRNRLRQHNKRENNKKKKQQGKDITTHSTGCSTCLVSFSLLLFCAAEEVAIRFFLLARLCVPLSRARTPRENHAEEKKKKGRGNNTIHHNR